MSDPCNTCNLGNKECLGNRCVPKYLFVKDIYNAEIVAMYAPAKAIYESNFIEGYLAARHPNTPSK